MIQVELDPDGTQGIGLLVIVKAATGVTYRQQCAGLATESRTVEGFLIPVGGPKAAKKLFDWFQSTFHGGCYSSSSRGSPWTPETSATLAELVAEIPCWRTDGDGRETRHFLQLDTERMDECVEAWIPVITPYGPGVLTLDNSD